MKTITRAVLLCLLAIFLLDGFSLRVEGGTAPTQPGTGSRQESLADTLTEITPAGWKRYDSVRRFTPETLYRHINGRAELFISYNVTNMTFVSYVNKSNPEQFIDISVYDMRSPTDAFGVYASERPQGRPAIAVGRAGYRSDASCFFWKGRHYVRIIASEATDALLNISRNLSKGLAAALNDSGEPVWGLTALPEVDREPESVQFFRMNAMGLDFMKNTYTTRYRKDGITVTVFLSKKDTVASAQETIARYKAFAEDFGETSEQLYINGVAFILFNMGDGYDSIFRKEHRPFHLIGGVSSVENRDLAIRLTTDLWRHLSVE